MERTISGMMGKGSVQHNTRAFSAKNVDKERSKDNVEFCNKNIKKVYHELFDEALERYNVKQKRSDRKIDDYYEKIRQGKQEKLFHEVIFQIGNKDDMNARSEDGMLAKQILTEFMEEFQSRNPNLYVFSAHLHMDEETPHLHIDFVPFIQNSKRGLDTRVSLKGALGEMGFKGGTRGATEWNQWIESEKKELAKLFLQYNFTDVSNREFTTITNIPRPLAYTLSETERNSLTTFGKSVLDREDTVFYGVSNNPYFMANQRYMGTVLIATIGNMQYTNETVFELFMGESVSATAEEVFRGVYKYMLEN